MDQLADGAWKAGGAASLDLQVIEQLKCSSVFIARAGVGRGNMEHRWGNRREVSRAVQLQTRGGVIARGRLCNVSTSGGYITTHLPVALFASVKVKFTAMVNGKRTHACVEGQVVRRDRGGVGIEWTDFAAEEVRALMVVPPFRLTPAAKLEVGNSALPPVRARRQH